MNGTKISQVLKILTELMGLLKRKNKNFDGLVQQFSLQLTKRDFNQRNIQKQVLQRKDIKTINITNWNAKTVNRIDQNE